MLERGSSKTRYAVSLSFRADVEVASEDPTVLLGVAVMVSTRLSQLASLWSLCPWRVYRSQVLSRCL